MASHLLHPRPPAYGFHSPLPLIAMPYLCFGGIEMDPPLPKPT
jgi:hypothetical protein